MDDEIKNINLKFECNAEWESMPLIDGVKHCVHCQKKVYDFTDANRDEFLKILSENNHKICGRFRIDQMTTNRLLLPAWKKWLSAAMFLVGINIFNYKAEAQIKKPDTIKQNTDTTNEGVFGVFGSIAASFSGGPKAFNQFISKNLRYTKDMKAGKVIVAFTITKNGTLTNIKILRKLGRANDNETLRVLKLSPKWAPSIANGKPITSTYTLPIKFDK